MSASLRQRARTIRVVRHGERVEGRSGHAEIRGEWFPARVVLGAAREADDRGHKKIIQAAQLVGRVDDLLSSDAIEVEGGARWRVTSQPEVLQPRSATPVVTAALERTIEAPRPVSLS
ncbi:MAG: hypothetical protein Q8K79_18495 [Solirubrobacteraceae bacterium]|nr:hypothetical protein [Solirubrobacteraceae bacterium]